MKFKNALLLASAATTITVFFACKSGNNESNTTENDSTAVQTDEKTVKAQNVFYSIPSPVEIATLMKMAGAKYEKSFLNPVENVSKYNTTVSKAINLGIYGSDLSFASIFEQTQESMKYLKCANSLSSSLGINGAFGAETMSRVEANLDNRDSLLEIISDAFWNTDSYLKENDRPNTSALIIAGGWLEGVYIATKVAQATNNPDIITRIGEQKLSLKNLISLIESYGKDAEAEPLLNELKTLQEIYNNVERKSEKVETTTDANTHVTTIGGSSSVAVSPEQLKAIAEKVQAIRNNIIQ